MGSTFAVDIAATGNGIARDWTLVSLPCRPIVDLIVTAAIEQSAFFLRALRSALVAAAELGGALFEAVFIWTAVQRLLVGVVGNFSQNA